MPGAVLARSDRDSLAGPPAWTRSTVHDFFRKTNWDNRPIEPPRARTISPYELSVSQFFHGVDWQWAPGVGLAGASLPELDMTPPDFDALDPDDLDLNGIGQNGTAAIDEGLTLDGFTDLF